ncbi:MAG: DUF4383 domain-containing protein [Bryobacteraceae bacterium]|jgi:hypothetical protein
MLKNFSKIQKIALGFAALFLFVYSLDYVPGIMAANGKMFGLFSMTPIVDFGHLALGTLAAISAFTSAKVSRIYFWALGVWYGIDVIMFFVSHFNSMTLLVNAAVNMPHFLTSIAAFWIAINVERSHAAPARA